MPLRLTTKLETGLEVELRVGGGSLADGAGVFNGMAQRCLAVDVLAGLKRV